MRRLANATLCAALLTLDGVPPLRPFSGDRHIPVPTSFGRLVERHLAHIRTYDPAITITGIRRNPHPLDTTGEDVNHLHIFTDSTHAMRYRSVPAFFDDIALILYHTDENGDRWVAQAAPPRARVQRSLIGSRDGTVRPARETYTPADEGNYAMWGTLFESDVLKTRPDLRYAYGIPYDIMQSPYILIDHQPCFVDSMLIMHPKEDGRFRLGAQRFDAYMTCTTPESTS